MNSTIASSDTPFPTHDSRLPTPRVSTIKLEGVSKSFRLYHRPADRVFEWLHLPARAREFWALRDIDLEIPPGRTLGIIGPNGAGKSTLLKIVTGTLFPTEGVVEVQGRVAALLELGTGFHAEFTGRQNIRINGQLLGLTPDEIASHEREIIDFSELGAFIDQPIRTYSSGMVMRLGFSIAASVEPQVLIIDEALAVGDARFSQKCIRRIRQFREAGCTILFVSHDPTAISTLCDEAVLLDQGRIVQRGGPDEVLERYGAMIARQGEGNAELRVRWSVPDDSSRDTSPALRYGTFHAMIARLALLREDGTASEVHLPGTTLRLAVSVLFLSRLSNPTVGFMIRDHLGVDVFGTNTALQGINLGDFEPGDTAEIEVRVPLSLGDGDYTVTAAVHRDETHVEECYDWSDRLALLRVRSASRPRSSGRLRIDAQWLHERRAGHGKSLSGALDALFGGIGDPLPVEGASPSPFLGGFHLPEHTNRGTAFRWCGLRGWFVFRPAHRRLLLGVGLPPESAGRTLSLKTVAGAEIGKCVLSDELAIVEFQLPAESVGQLALFELAVDAVWHERTDTGPGRGLGFALYAVRTISPESDSPEWDAIVASNSSPASTAS